MSTVAEIQSAISRLTPQEVEELAAWLDEYRQMIRASAEVFSLYDQEEGKPQRLEPAPAKSGRGPSGVPAATSFRS